MTNLTRIKNNQVTDSTIVASAKLVPGTITGGLFSDPISYTGSMTISGNLTVQGTTTTVDTINTLVADPVIVLSKGETGSPSNDSGFLVERGTSDNAAFLWDETNDRFMAITTTSDGLSGGSISVGGYANIKISDAEATTASLGNIDIATNSITSTNANGNIDITPNGSGDINLGADTVVFGDANTQANITTNGTANLVISTNSGTNSGNIQLAQGTNGNITITANGTGEVVTNTLAITDLTSGRVVLAGSSGAVNDSANLTFNGTVLGITGNVTVSDTANIGNVRVSGNDIISTNTNGNINITPAGSGNINLGTDTIVVGDSNASTLITTSGTGNLNLSTNSGTNSGNIQIAQGTNGNITITANGTGEVVTNTLAISDLTSGRILIAGASGAVIDSANLTFDGTELFVSGLSVTGAGGVSFGNISITNNDITSIDTNGNINITPNGTGDINLGADKIVVGDSNTESIVTTNGTGNLLLSTNDGTNSGNIKITQGTNGNITITANGTGEVVTNTLAVSDLTSGRFIIAGTNGKIEDSANFTYSGSDVTLLGDLAVEGGDVTTVATTVNLFNSNATTVNFAGAATTLEIGAASGTTNVNNNLDVDGNINLDGSEVTTTAATVNLANANTTTLNIGGAATAVNIGAATGTTIVKNDLQVDGGDLTFGAATTANIANATVTTLHIGQAATTIEIGAASGTTNVNNDLDVDGDINMDGGDFTVTTATVNIANANATTVNFAGAATTLELGAASGTTNVNNNLDVDGNINLDGANFTVTASTVNIANANATTVNFAGAATALEIGAATGTTNINNNLDVDGNINLDGGNFTTTAATVNIANANSTTVNFAGAATALTMGGVTGTTTINNDLQINGNDIKSSTGNVAITMNDIDVTIAGNLTVQGVTTNVGTQDLIVEDSLINLHTTANLAPLVADDGRDIGFIFHYYKTSDKQAGLVWANDTQALEYYVDATESGSGTFAGTYGNIKAASFWSNVADGIAPFLVNSTTRVANLNVAASGIANTVVDAAQPNITSLGNLSILNIDNVQINDNTISTTNTNGNLILSPNGTGDVQLDADTVRIGDSGDPATLTTNGAANLLLSTNEGTNSGNIQIVNGVNGNINITTNGTGDINLVADSVVIGDANAEGTVTTNGTGNLVLSTNAGTSSGNIILAQGTNGNITITANGTGEVVTNTLAVSDLTSGRVTLAGTNGALVDSANLTFASDVLGVTGNLTVSATANLGNIRISANDIISTNSNGNIDIAPNGTGDINLAADNIVVGDFNAPARITTSGIGTLTINTNSGTNAGNIILTEGANSNININANGTGEIILNTLAVGDLTSGRVPYVSTNSTIIDDANLAFSGTLLTVTGSANITSTANIGNIQITSNSISSTDTNGNVSITPNGTGDINLSADTVVVGDANTQADITTNGTGNLKLSTNSGTNSGNIVLTQGTNGNITITANGTGEVVTNTLVVSDLTSGRLPIISTNGALIDSANLTFASDVLGVTGNLTISNTANLGNIQISGNTISSTNLNGNINISSNSGITNIFGDLVLGTNNTATELTTNGTANLIINTNFGTNSGSIEIIEGVNGNINISANGSGLVKLTSTMVGSLTANRLVYASADGLLVDSSNLTYDGSRVNILGNLLVSDTATIANIQINGNTISTTNTNGNLNFEANGTGDIVINSTGDNSDFYVYGNTASYANALIYGKSSSGQVGILTETPAAGVSFHINALDAMIIPTGATGDRPLTPVTGMLRFNTSLGFVEFFDGTLWASTSGSFTVINYENFSGDGSTLNYTMSAAGTSAGTLVAINGVLQQPSTAYSVSGTSLIFTEAPLAGDDIDVRRLTTTAAIGSLEEGDTKVELTDTGTDGTINLIADATTILTVTNALVVSSGDVRPNADSTLDLGSSSYRWQDIYSTNANVANVETGTTLSLKTGGTARLTVSNALVETSVNLAPNGNATLDLGAASYRWQDIYSANIDTVNVLATTGNITTVNATTVNTVTLNATTINYGGAPVATTDDATALAIALG